MPPADVPVFRIALSLTGGVSTGAFVAGALDFLVEALDVFQAAKDAGDPRAPPHAVLLEAICGASSGALAGGVVASALRYAFPPVAEATSASVRGANPLYDAWVEATGAAELLGTGDAADAGLRSLFDSTSLDAVTARAIAFGPGVATRSRDWLADPLRVCFSVTNLEGIAYTLAAKESAAAARSVLHADVLRFNLRGLGAATVGRSLRDELDLAFPASGAVPRSSAWRAFGDAAIASAAFPIVLAPRTIVRAKSAYARSSVVVAGVDGRATALPLTPSFAPGAGVDVAFTAVDGGLVDNSPVDLARAALNQRDPTARNLRCGRCADRAVVTIDPLLEGTRAARRTMAERVSSLAFLASAGPLLMALIDQARFRPDEVALAQAPDVFSRFLIAPSRDGGASVGGRHLAGASCAGFGGYLEKAFREHDFLLGRCNAQACLARELTLPEKNKLFDDWSPELIARYRTPDGQLPIVPLIGRLHPDVRALPLPDWPAGRADLDDVGRLLETRLDLVHRKLVEGWRPRGALVLAKWIEPLFWGLVRRRLRVRAVATLAADLREHGLS